MRSLSTATRESLQAAAKNQDSQKQNKQINLLKDDCIYVKNSA